MIELPFCEFKRFLLAYRLIFNPTRRFYPPQVNIQSDTTGVRFIAANSQANVRHLAGSRDDGRTLARFGVEYQKLLAISARNDQLIQITVRGETVTFSWEQKGIPQQLTTNALEFDTGSFKADLNSLGAVPTETTFRDDYHLLEALREAYQTADLDGAGRYTLNTILLDGEAGTMCATDGCQALIQKGYAWPWKERILVPATKLFNSAAWLKLAQKERWKIRVWRQENVIWMEFDQTVVGLVTIDGRFPNLELVLTNDLHAKATLELDETDAQFLLEKIDCLPMTDPDTKSI